MAGLSPIRRSLSALKLLGCALAVALVVIACGGSGKQALAVGGAGLLLWFLLPKLMPRRESNTAPGQSEPEEFEANADEAREALEHHLNAIDAEEAKAAQARAEGRANSAGRPNLDEVDHLDGDDLPW